MGTVQLDTKRSREAWPGFLTGLGLFGFVVSYMVAGSTEWGPPGTSAYGTYQTANRLVSLPIVLLIVGIVSLGVMRRGRMSWLGRIGWAVTLSGSVLLLVGNVAEFWVFTSRTYDDQARKTSWALFLLGAASLVIGGILWAAANGRNESVSPQGGTVSR